MQLSCNRLINLRQVAKSEVQFASVLLGNVLNVNEFQECRKSLLLRQDEDLGLGTGQLISSAEAFDLRL